MKRLLRIFRNSIIFVAIACLLILLGEYGFKAIATFLEFVSNKVSMFKYFVINNYIVLLVIILLSFAMAELVYGRSTRKRRKKTEDDE